VFLDANILFSAAKSDGAIRRLLELLAARGDDCYVDDYVVAEARRNLEKKGPAAIEELDRLLIGMRVLAVKVMPRPQPDVDWLPEKDRPVLAAAIGAACNVLVTGDRAHFGSGYGRTFAGVVIHSPRSLAETLLR
ncbi:MAG TPA: PIN domain-containing protein, partial [Burkholderiaceae bacterium]|nr:PIN domain-containing protein [Burkholderiaceae bacterium]